MVGVGGSSPLGRTSFLFPLFINIVFALTHPDMVLLSNLLHFFNQEIHN